MFGSALASLWLVIFFGANPVTFYQDETEDYIFRTGWYNGHILRFVPFAASDLPVAKELDEFAYRSGSDEPVDYAPALAGILNVDAFNEVYLINSLQVAVFSTQPGLPAYTPLWRVHVLEWKRGATRTPLTSEAQVLAAIGQGRLLQVRPLSILDATIVQDTSGNVLPQLTEFELIGEDRGEVEFAQIFVYAPRSKAHQVACVVSMLLTDVSDQSLANQLGANYAPRMINITSGLCNPAYAFVNPVPLTQAPIIDQVQTYRTTDYIQSNLSYNPVKFWTLLNRGTLPYSSIINNIPYANYLIGRGVIIPTPTGPFVTNSPVSLPES
jgi:hypothetical protein